MPSEKDLTVEVLTGVRAVPAAEWDALLSPEDTPFVRHAWLSSLEDAGCVRPEVGWLPRTLVVREAGRLVAAAPVYLKGNSEGEFVFDHSWHRFAERLGVAYLPKLIVAVPFTPATGRRLLVAPGQDRGTWSLVLSRALRELVRELDVSSAHVLFAQEGDADALVEDGWAPRVGVQFHWENHGYSTYDDFLATFNAKRRHQLKRERREVLASGLDVRTYRGSEITDEVMSAMERFYLASVERFHPWTRQYLNRAFFDLVLSRMPESIEIVLARDAGRPIAGAFNVSGGGRLYGRYWGAVEERPFLHFHVCYYHSIEDCIARGLSAFEPGAGGEHKLPRGFEPRLTRSAHVLVDPRLDRAVRQFVAQEKAAIESELAGRDA